MEGFDLNIALTVFYIFVSFQRHFDSLKTVLIYVASKVQHIRHPFKPSSQALWLELAIVSGPIVRPCLDFLCVYNELYRPDHHEGVSGPC